MHLISLDLENFRQHAKTSIEFLPGVTAIIGKNGAGKSTVLEALAWALYGGSAVRGTNDTIRCRTSEGNSPVEVKLVFSLGPHVYTVTRRLEGSRSSANLLIDGSPSRTGFKEVTESVAKLLGMDYQAFFTSFFTGQKEIEFMRAMDGRQRAAAISRMLGYERLVRARDKANNDRLGLQREIEGLERGLGDPEEIKRRKSEAKESVSSAELAVKAATEEESTARKEVDRLKPLRDLSEEKFKHSQELSRLIELESAEEKRAAERLKELTAEVRSLDESAAELEALQPQIEEFKKAGDEYKRLAELQKHEARRSEIQGQIAAVEQDVRMLEARVSDLKDAAEDLTMVETVLADIDRQLGEVELRIQEEKDKRSAARHRAEAELAQLKLQMDEISEKRRTIETAGQNGACPTCDRPLGEELPKVLAGFDDHAAKLASRAESLKKTLSELEKDSESLTALITMRDALEKTRDEKLKEREAASCRKREFDSSERQLATKRESIAALSSELEKLPSGFSQERFSELREIGDKLRPIRDREIKLKTALDRRESVEADLARQQESLDRSRGELETARKSLADVGFSREEHEKLVAEFDAASTQYHAARLTAERARGDLRVAQAALAEAENDDKVYKTREAELRESRKKRLYLQTLAESFDRLRTDLNNRAAPELAIAASEILSDLTDGRYSTLEVDPNYEASIREDGELKPVISGGEEDIVNLSLRLAVSQMIADRAGQDLTLLILDEVFGSLDDIRRENVVALLQTLKSRFEQIIVITHIESVHDAVDNCLWVDYDEAAKVSQVRVQGQLEVMSEDNDSITLHSAL